MFSIDKPYWIRNIYICCELFFTRVLPCCLLCQPVCWVSMLGSLQIILSALAQTAHLNFWSKTGNVSFFFSPSLSYAELGKLPAVWAAGCQWEPQRRAVTAVIQAGRYPARLAVCMCSELGPPEALQWGLWHSLVQSWLVERDVIGVKVPARSPRCSHVLWCQ